MRVVTLLSSMVRIALTVEGSLSVAHFETLQVKLRPFTIHLILVNKSSPSICYDFAQPSERVVRFNVNSMSIAVNDM